MLETQKKDSTTSPDKTVRPSWLISKFIWGWLGSLLLLAVIALSLDVDWAKPKVEEVLTQQLHRKVFLGHLRWRIGLNGLQFLTRSMKIDEFDGDPFMTARGTNLGVSMTHLLAGQLKIKYLQIDHPEIFAIKIKPGAWNFEDLLDDQIEIQLIEVDSGVLHIQDQSKKAATRVPFTIQNLNVKYNWPRRNINLPFYLSMTLPHQDTKQTPAYVRLDGYGQSPDGTLQNTQFKLQLTGKDLRVKSLRHLATIIAEDQNLIKTLNQEDKTNKQALPEVKGQVSLEAQLSGTLTAGFAARVDTKVTDLLISSKDFCDIKTQNLATSGNIAITEKNVDWKDLNFKVGQIELKTNGKLKNWQDKESSYDIDLASNIKDLSNITRTIDLSKVKLDNPKDAYKLIKTATLSGQAFFSFKAMGQGQKYKYLTQLEAGNLPVNEIIAQIAPGAAPYAAMLGVTSNSSIKGHFEMQPGRRILIKDGQLNMPDSVLKIKGVIDLLRDSADLDFDLSELSLKKAWAAALNDPQAREAIYKKFPQIKNRQISIQGIVSAKGHLINNKSGLNVNMASNLKQGGVGLFDRTLNAYGINGQIEILGKKLVLKNIDGKVGTGGRFTFGGNIDGVTTDRQDLDLVFFGNNLAFSHLSNTMELLNVKFPTITENHLTGRVKELSIKLSGNAKKPKIYMSAAPEDIRYRPPGLKRSLKAVSGSFLYENDNVTLQDVGIISRGLRLTTSMRIDNVTGAAALKRLHVKTDGIELSDIDYYLGSTVMPAPVRKQYWDLLKFYSIRNLHGRVYGDMVVVPNKKNDFDLEGVMGCYSVGAVVSRLNIPLERISGIVAASQDELLIQDLSGHARSTQFELDGYVRAYKSKNPNWKTELKAEIAPQEFFDLIPALAEAFGGSKSITISSNGPLGIRAKIDGDMHTNQVSFSAHADSANDLKISAAGLTLNQPPQEEINLDGALTLKEDGINLKSTNLHLGAASLTAQGQWQWGQKYPDQPISLTVLSPNPVPAKILLGLVDPTMDTRKMAGVVDGFFALEGPLRQPKLTGKISLDHISDPDFNISDLSGTAATDDDLARDNPKALTAARLNISRIKIKDMEIKDIGGHLFVHAQDNNEVALPADAPARPPFVAIRDVTARIAGGLVRMDGGMDMEKHQVSMNAFLSKIDMQELAEKLLGASNEISGTMDGQLHLAATGNDAKAMVSTLAGSGDFVIKDGMIARFGQLQTKLTQANLLSQGIFGFNLNNLLQSVVPIRSGEFNEVRSKYQIYKGVLDIQELRYSGDDLRMWGAGTQNLATNQMEMEIAGTIPRVTKSMLGGAFGDLSRSFTVSKLLHQVTFGTLENLPPLPIIGDIASDKPRTFAFKVNAPATDTKLVTKSIEKSFKWLPNKQAASAHPVPGL